MDPLLSSRLMYLNQLPPVINISTELDDAMRAYTTKCLQKEPSVEANAVIGYGEGRFYLINRAMGSPNSSTTDHAGVRGVGMYHSHPHGGPIDVGDLNKMLEHDRRTENFSMVDGTGDRRTALFKTIDSPTRFTGAIQRAQSNYEKKHVIASRKDLVDEIVENARCAFMGYYEGRGLILYRVYPDEKAGKASREGLTSRSRR